MFELRVLDGSRQGAALPLFGGQWSIGAHPEADLSLYDEGIAERHVVLRYIEQCWSVQAQEGLVRANDGRLLAQIADLALDVPFSIGNIRLCVTLADQPWPQAPAAAPVPSPARSVKEAAAGLTLSSISGMMSQAANDVWRRACASNGEMRTRRWMPFSERRKP